jgi:hypothetical protein
MQLQSIQAVYILGFLGCTAPKSSDTGTHPVNTTPNWNVIESLDTDGAWLRAHIPSDDPNQVWLIGGQPEVGAIKIGNSLNGFQKMPLPEGTPLLNWADGTSDNMWAGGLYGTILHWNGNEWNDHSLDIEEAIWGLHVSEDSVMVVGGSSRWGGERGVVFEWNESDDTWIEWTLPAEVSDINNVFKVTNDGYNYWMVGTSGTVLYGRDRFLTPIPTGITQDLITVEPNTNGGVNIVGGRGTGLFLQGQDGSISDSIQLIAGINGVATGENEMHLLVGEMGFATLLSDITADISTLIQREIPPQTTHILHAANVHTIDGKQYWYGVGGNLGTANSTFEGSILSLEWPQ